VTQNGKLCLEPQQVALRGAIQLPLLGRSVSAIAFGHVTGDGKRGEDEGVGRALRFTSCTVANDAKHLTTECNGLLPDFEIADAPSHAPKMKVEAPNTGINRLREVSEVLSSMVSFP